MPKSSRAEPGSLLIAAISGRMLAASARRAGFVPLVADFFADADTAALTHSCKKLDGDYASGMTWPALEAALAALAEEAPAPLIGFVYGAGFEDRPSLLDRIAARWPVLGNDAATVARIKDPEIFFATLGRLGVAHPRTSLEAPPAMRGWLVKRRGGAGGSHIRVRAGRGVYAADYFQERAGGQPLSALFVANGREARVLGFSAQWTAPARGRPYRYGGAVRVPEPSPPIAAAMRYAVELVAPAFALRGLGSADFMVQGDHALLLEINPRPGATLDIFDSDAEPLLGLHLDAVLRRSLPPGALDLEGAAASAIVFAEQALRVPDVSWPDWAQDRPKAGDRIDKDGPICTVLARAATPAEARRMVEERIARIRAACRGDGR